VATTTTTTLPPKGTLVIHGVGDVNVDPSYIPVLATEGYDHAWSGVSDVFTTDDLTVVNLECPVATVGSPADKAFTFRCDPDALDEMVEAGVDVTGQANNHVLDFGVDAMLESRELLTAAGLIPVGTGPDAEAAYAPHLIDVGGWTIAVLGFSGPRGSSTWPATDERPGMADARDPEAMNAAIAAADAIADLVVVTVHWGVELDVVPRADQVARARGMVAAGADIIFGHHAHRLQPMSRLDGAAIFWGLGNFVWPRLSAAGSTTAVAEVVVSPDGEITEACLIPATIVSSGHPELDAPYGGCAGIESPTIDLG
jgi:poly-gamma-glutamate capsule biosynthesis protein CapA/YwtB (metallophosphatase superfamily)